VVVFDEALAPSTEGIRGLLQHRIDLSLHKDAPDFPHVQPVDNIVALPLIGGLNHHYVRL